jgi:hypothetical protein
MVPVICYLGFCVISDVAVIRIRNSRILPVGAQLTYLLRQRYCSTRPPDPVEHRRTTCITYHFQENPGGTISSNTSATCLRLFPVIKLRYLILRLFPTKISETKFHKLVSQISASLVLIFQKHKVTDTLLFPPNLKIKVT